LVDIHLFGKEKKAIQSMVHPIIIIIRPIIIIQVLSFGVAIFCLLLYTVGPYSVFCIDDEEAYKLIMCVSLHWPASLLSQYGRLIWQGRLRGVNL